MRFRPWLFLFAIALGGIAWWLANDSWFGPVRLPDGGDPSLPGRAVAPEDLPRPFLSPAAWSAHAVPGGCLIAGPSGDIAVGFGVFEGRRESFLLWSRDVAASGITHLSMGVGGAPAEGSVRLFRHLARMEIAPGSVAVLLAAVAAGRPLEISNGRQTLLLRGRMPQDALASHRTCVTSLG